MQFKPDNNFTGYSPLEKFYLDKANNSNFTFFRTSTASYLDKEPTRLLTYMLSLHGLNLENPLEYDVLVGNGKVNGVVRSNLTESINHYNSTTDQKHHLGIVILSNAVDQTTSYLESENYQFDHTLERLATYKTPVKALRKTYSNGIQSTYIILTINDYPDIRRAISAYLLDHIKPEGNSPTLKWLSAYDAGDDEVFTDLLIAHEAETKQFEESKNKLINQLFLGPKARVKTQLKSELRDVKQRITSMEESLAMYSKNLFDIHQKIHNFKEEGLTDTEKEEANLLMDVLTKNPTIKKFTIDSGNGRQRIILDCVAPLKFYDKDFFARHMVREGNTTELRILDEIINHIPGSKIQLAAQLVIDVGNFGVAADRPFNNVGDWVPQPHLVYHSCFGDNSRTIRDLLREGKLSEALVATISCMYSINFLDGTVFSKFKRDIVGSRKYLLLKNGTYIGVDEILKMRSHRIEAEEKAKLETAINEL